MGVIVLIRRRAVTGAIAGAVALAAVILVPAVDASAAVPVAPYNSVSIDAGARTDGQYTSRTSAVYDQNDTFNGGIQSGDSLSFQLLRTDTTGLHFLTMRLDPPTGQQWVAGTTYPVTYNADASHANIDLGIDGDDCSAVLPGSSLTISEVLRDSGGALTGLAGSYSALCNAGLPPFQGIVRWNSTQDYVAAAASTNRIVFGDQPITVTGVPKTITYTARGSLSSTFGTAVLGGANASAFLITEDTCSSATLSYGQTCSVSVAPKATAPGAQAATLTIPDNSLVGFRFAQLELNGVDSHVVHFDSTVLTFSRSELGVASAPQPVTVTVVGPSSVTFGAATFGATSPDSFKLSSDSCSNQTVAPGNSCVMQVVADPVSVGQLGASLILPDNSVQGWHAVSLFVEGFMPPRGSYFPTNPYRLLDTRAGTGAPKAAVTAGKVVHLQVTGRGEVPPTGVGAVVLNVTVTAPTAAGYVSVYPTGSARPTVSSLNFPRGFTGANSVTVAVGTGGRVDLYNFTGSTQLIADVVGYYAADTPIADPAIGGEYQPFQPKRLLDTREWGSKLPAGYYIQLPVDFGADVNPHVRALAVNVTAVAPARAGFLTTWNGLTALPNASTLNYTKNATVANFAIVPTLQCWDCTGDAYAKPTMGIYTSADAHVIVDVFGFYDDSTLGDGLRFHPMAPVRIADSRVGLGTPHALGQGVTAVVTPPASVLDSDTMALALNVTAIAPTTGTYLTVWPNGIDGFGKPAVSNVNASAGAVVPNAVATIIGPSDGAINIYNNGGSTNVCVDVVGSFYFYPYKLSANTALGVTSLGSHRPSAVQPAPVVRRGV